MTDQLLTNQTIKAAEKKGITMKIVNAKFTIKPEKRENFLEDILNLIKASQTDAGCLAYDLFESNTEPNVFMMIEKWSDAQALDNHNKNQTLLTFATKVPEYISQKPEIIVMDHD
ncbi:MAG: putative quinol monooxygenase [Lactococcus raffinolactis]